MVKNGHATRNSDALVVEFQNRRRPSLQLEAFPLSHLFPRATAEHWGTVQRLQFHLWVVFTAGTCRHMVDFDFIECRPGTVLHVHPGQVHRWDRRRGLQGHVLVMTPALMPPMPTRQKVPLYQSFIDDDAWPAAVTLPAAHRRRVTGWFEKLETTAREPDDSPASMELLRHLVSVALLDVFRSCKVAPAAMRSAERLRMRQFKLDIERSFRVTRSVHDFATALRCSTKTLDRTCRTVIGMSAKACIDSRVVLEAKRHLAHTDETVERISSDLGFTEPTNFVKFFKARTRSAPGAFRRRFRESTPRRADR